MTLSPPPGADGVRLTKAQERQELHDTFYHAHGPCCSGCDWWRSFNSHVGECSRSAPMSGSDRSAMLGITGCSMAVGAGHAMTRREHLCGEFKDDFDWSGLPPHYLRRIGRAALSTPPKENDHE